MEASTESCVSLFQFPKYKVQLWSAHSVLPLAELSHVRIAVNHSGAFGRDKFDIVLGKCIALGCTIQKKCSEGPVDVDNAGMRLTLDVVSKVSACASLPIVLCSNARCVTQAGPTHTCQMAGCFQLRYQGCGG